MKILDSMNTYTLYTPEKAREVAVEMNETDDWEYIVVDDPAEQGFSFIEIYDENNEFVARM